MSHGITIGFFGEPAKPMVEAIGMPISMWVACKEPDERLSRIAAQFAPFVTVELMPYFLNRPFSCAITIGEQSVSAIMPKRRSGVSGALELAVDDGLAGRGVAARAVVLVLLSDLQAPSVAAAPRPSAPCMKRRRSSGVDFVLMLLLRATLFERLFAD